MERTRNKCCNKFDDSSNDIGDDSYWWLHNMFNLSISIYLLCSGLANRNFSSKCWSRFLFLFIFFEHMLCLAGLSCAMGLIRLHDVIVYMCWSLKLMTWLKLKGCQVNVVIFLYGWINRIKHSRTLKTGFNLTKKNDTRMRCARCSRFFMLIPRFSNQLRDNLMSNQFNAKINLVNKTMHFHTGDRALVITSFATTSSDKIVNDIMCFLAIRIERCGIRMS